MKYINATRHRGARFEESTQLELTTTLLRETKDREGIRMFVKLADIRTAVKEDASSVRGYWADYTGYGPRLLFSVQARVIGCCSFSKAEFSKLLKVAKVKR